MDFHASGSGCPRPVAACGNLWQPSRAPKERLQSSTCSNTRGLEAWRLGGLEGIWHIFAHFSFFLFIFAYFS